jgi:uroporphyrinogen-III synthase
VKTIHILSTRSIQTPLIEQAGSAGIQIDQKEFIRTEPFLSPDKAALVREIPEHATLVFTSTNAVEVLFKLVHEYDIPVPAHCNVFSVDGRTSLAINTLFPSFLPLATSENARALAEEMLKHDIKQAYYPCGNIRRDELPSILKARGISVREMELYRTEATPEKIERVYDGLIFFSPSAVSSFFSLNEIPPHTTCFAIGETTANAIREQTTNDIVIAAKPRQDNIISMIIKHYQSR